MRYHLRVEGVNFDSCLFDTNDISVIRGSSLLFDSIAEPVDKALASSGCQNITKEWAGASIAHFSFDATDEPAAEQVLAMVRGKLQEPPYKHLSFVASLGETLEKAAARNKAMQFRQWTVPDCTTSDASRQDALDGVRPADPKKNDSIKGALSVSVAARLNYGRQYRKEFFETRVPDKLPADIKFSDSFHDLVADPPDWVAESVKNKIAVIHFDGDGFGKARDAKNDPQEFSRELDTKMNKLLGNLVEAAIENDRLRIETLVWGGDDITLVVPAWHALTCVRCFFYATENMTLADQKVGFTGGVIVANYKAPIRLLTALADDAVNSAKQAGARGGFSFDAFESAALPEDGLTAHRTRTFGQADPRLFSIPGDQTHTLIKILTDWKTDEAGSYPSRSRIYDLLSTPATDVGSKGRWIKEELLRDAQRLRDTDDCIGTEGFLPVVKGCTREAELDLMIATTLWDYVPDRTDAAGFPVHCEPELEV